MKNSNFFSAFEAQFASHSAKQLIEIAGVDAITYKQVDHKAAQLANCLSDLGVKTGDRVSVQVEKSPEALYLYLACLRAGFVFHPLNPAYQASELDYFLNNAEPSVLVCDAKSLAPLESIASRANIQHTFSLNADGSGSLMNAAADSDSAFQTVHRDTDDMACLLYSSGTTGVPKGIMLSHKNLSANAQTLTQAWGFTEQDKLLHTLPIFHVHGLFVALGCVLLSGASMRWLTAFDKNQVVQYLPECTVFMGVPTYYTRLLDEASFTQETTKNIRLFISGSAPLLAETFEQFEQLTGHRILERYGMTETNMNTSNPLHGERLAGTVGPALPGVEARVVNENGELVLGGEIGNLQIKGENVFKGYWKLPEKTAEDFTDDGFFNTGDKAKIDDNNYVSIVGRSKDVVITGGLNVYPKEVELLIDDIDGVKESAVIGIPHADFGEAVIAIVILEDGGKLSSENAEEEVISHARKQLANFKIPKQVIVLAELPRNTMGKVQKNMLREQYS